MKILRFNILLISLFASLCANAAVYKCENENGKVSYQATPCAKNEASSEVKISSSAASNNEPSTPNKGSDPSGNWVNPKGLTTNLSSMGGFQMTDISGGTLSGTWINKNGTYTVSAKFHGETFPVNMKYDSESDSLHLSKPGMPNTLVKYQRR